MKNDTCVICGNNFEPREGKLYCSEKCKQYAYRKKSIKNEDNPSIQTNEAKKAVLYRINYNEYLQVKEKSDILKNENHEVYAFFRKNLSGNVDVDFIVKYFEEVDIDGLYNNSSSIYKGFQKFKEMICYGQVLFDNLPLEPKIEKPTADNGKNNDG